MYNQNIYSIYIIYNDYIYLYIQYVYNIYYFNIYIYNIYYDAKSTLVNSPIWIIMFFCYLHTVGFWSIFTFIMSFRKNKYQIHSYTTFNMDDFKTICIYENLLVFAYFLINGRIRLVSLGNPTFSNIFSRAKHVRNTFKLWTLCERFVSFRWVLFICSCYLSKHPLLCELFWYPSPDDGYWNRNV